MAKLLFEPQNDKDKPIVEIKGGHDDGTFIFLNQGNCCDECTPKCNKVRRCCVDCYGGCDDCGSSIRDMKEFKIVDSGKMTVIPKLNGSQHGFIFGFSGCGKSFFCNSYATNYRYFFPKNDIYLVSYLSVDPSLEEKRLGITRIPLEDIMNDEITVDSIANSLIIFDDVDAKPVLTEEAKEKYKPAEVFIKVESLRDQLLTTGRHGNVSVLVTSHLGTDHKHTKAAINEASFVVVYPLGGNAKHITGLLTGYCGLDKKQKAKIDDLKTKWVMLSRPYPPYIVYEKGVYLL